MSLGTARKRPCARSAKLGFKLSLPVIFAAVFTGQRAPTAGEVVFPAARVEISSAPGMASHGLLDASAALVLSKSGIWTRLLGADGTTGWARNVTGQRAPASARLTEMMSRSPDDPDFAAAAEPVAVSPQENAAIVGATAESRLPSMDRLLLPEWTNPFLTPWLKLEAGSRTGWQSPALVSLVYSLPLEGRPLQGLTRAPFLGPALAELQALKPAGAQPVWRFSDLRAKPERSPAPTDFGDAELLLRLPAGVGQAITQFTVYPSKNARLFTFQSGRLTPVHAIVESYAPLVTAFATADLDRDGANDLLLEMVQTYGDGWISTLWIVDGKSVASGLRVAAVPLGGAGGEPGASELDAAWWVEDGRLWIVRHEKEPGKAWVAVSAIYRDGKLTSTQEPSYAAVLGRASSNLGARRTAWAAQKRLGRAVHVFPGRTRVKGDDWLAGCLFKQQVDAKAIKGVVEVIQLPAGTL